MLQVHCIPRPGRRRVRYRVHACPAMFAFHHVNAFETTAGAVVVDTLARDTITFGGNLRDFLSATYATARTKTTLRRLVCRRGERQACVHDLRQVPALDRVLEFATPLPPARVGRPHHVLFSAVRS